MSTADGQDAVRPDTRERGIGVDAGYAALAALAYYVLALAGIRLSFAPDHIAVFWPANAVVLAFLLFRPVRHWWMYLLAVALGESLSAWPQVHSVARCAGLALANIVEVALAAGIVRLLCGRAPRLDTLWQMIVLLGAATLAAPSASAFVGAWSVALERPEVTYWVGWQRWFLGDAIGHLALTPLLLATAARGRSQLRRVDVPGVLEAGAVTAILVLMVVIAFGRADVSDAYRLALWYTPMPVLIWAALRAGVRGVGGGVLLLTVMSIWFAADGHGPFTGATPAANVLALQACLAVTATPLLLLGAVVDERRQALALLRDHQDQLELRVAGRTAELRAANDELSAAAEHHRRTAAELHESETRFRALFDHSLNGVVICEMIRDDSGEPIDYVHTHANPATQTQINLRPADLCGRRAREVVGAEEADRLVSAFTPVVDSGIPTRFVMELPTLGRFLEIEAIGMGGGRFAAAFSDVTARIRAERELKRSEERLRQIVQNMPVMMDAFDEAGSIIAWNREAARVTGYSAAEIVNNPRAIELLYPDPEYRRRMLKQIDDAGVNFRELEWQLTCKDGTKRTILWSNLSGEFPIPGWHAWAVGIDITARKRAEEAARVAEARARALFDKATDAIFVHDLEGRFVAVNQVACDRLGYSREELLKMGPADIDSPEFGKLVPDRIRTLERDEMLCFESAHQCRDGKTIPVEINSHLIEFDGKPAIISVARDITERRQAETERRRLETHMQHVQKLESLGVLAGGIAHDFNNLLVGILGNADLALDELSSESPVREPLLGIETAARRAADLTRQMLAYSGKGRFVVQAFDLNNAIREMTHLLQVAIHKDVVLKLNLAPNVPPIEADATQIRQVVMNLVTNASEAIGERSGIVSVSTGAVECDEQYLESTYLNEELEPGLYVYLEVADTGCGMDAETQEKIFEPFFTTKFAGRGLGLAAVLGIVRGHGGALRVYSERGKGSTFKLLFPALEESAIINGNPPEQARKWRGSGTVLLVDDDETVISVGRRMLEHVGFDVLTARDGAEAVAQFRAAVDDIVCVVLDLTMPHLDGEQTFRELRRLKPEVRVVLSSGYNELEVTQRFAGKGLAGFIQKPYRQADLLEVVRNACEEHTYPG